MKSILVCNIFKHYTIKSIKKAFELSGYKVNERDYFTPEDIYHDDKLEGLIQTDIRSNHYDFIFTVNYSPIVSSICYKNNLRYVSWTYDTPMNLPSLETMDNPSNYNFIFDHGEYLKYKEEGLETVYYLPLATDFDAPEFSNNGYKYDVSLLGNLYRSTFPAIKKKLDEYQSGFLDGIITSQRKIYGSYFILELLKYQNSELESINKTTGFNLSPEQLSYSLASYITYMDRLSLLSIMSNRFSTALVTASITESERNMMTKLTVLPKMDYYKEMPLFFRMSKINLNPPFRAVWSAIPQRALDIMSSGGFLLSGYTEELSYYFENSKELVLYDSIEDAVAKADFYLKHDDLRLKIQTSGTEKVRKDFTYIDRIYKIINTVHGGNT
ncbi:glycosyltransferase family protein [Oribacterium sp. NK2B42]|uniref:glycosyltransferase family protein n=1 Tax=Oribacterium sp. NK2B42 TaxID=689781 RepID=UPI0004274EEF|nr:glycosyltransferase [Oribacterium sp. NK2B42]